MRLRVGAGGGAAADITGKRLSKLRGGGSVGWWADSAHCQKDSDSREQEVGPQIHRCFPSTGRWP